MDNQQPKRIIIFCLPGIGDAILFTPALGLLRRALPNARITAVTMFQGTADILVTNPDLDEVRHFDFYNAGKLKGLRYVQGLRRERFDLSIMPFPSNRLEYNLVNWLVGRRWSAAHRYQHQSWQNLWFLNNITVNELGTLHNVEENLRLARALCERFGATIGEARPELKLTLTADDEQYAERYFREYGFAQDTLFVGLHTYSSTFKNMTRKCWDKDNFVALIRRLGEADSKRRFLLFSGPADEANNQYIMQHVDERVHLVREANLRRALAILRRCRLFVCNDAALMHLAAALRVPIVALFGPTNWQRLHPWSENHVIVRKDLPCMPCFYYSSRPLHCVAGVDYACMREISVEEVFSAVQKLLATTDEKPVTAAS
jgi:heptosyltransferase-2